MLEATNQFQDLITAFEDGAEGLVYKCVKLFVNGKDTEEAMHWFMEFGAPCIRGLS